MNYVFYISEFLCTKNKLEAAVASYLFGHNRLLIDENEVAVFIAGLICKVLELNKQYQRCSPVHLIFQQSNIKSGNISDSDYLLHQPNFIRGKLIACAKEVKS